MKPNTDRPLETELVEASFNNAYKEVMALGTAIESRQAGIESSLATIASDVGDVTALATEDKDNLVEAINEVNTKAGNNATAIGAMAPDLAEAKYDISSLQSTKVNKTTTVNGHALSDNVTVTKSDVGLGDVANVGSSATPADGGTDNFTTGGAYTELAKKADVSDTGDKANLTTTAKDTLVAAINELDSDLNSKADDSAVVKLTGDQTVAGVKTFSSAPKIPSLTTETPVTTTALVGYDENGNLIPAVGGGGGSSLPASADYVGTNSTGEPIKGTADTTVTPGSSALVTSGAVATALSSKADSSDVTSALATKQDALDSDQLAAVNSGIDSTKVSTYDGYAASIDAKCDLTNIAAPFASGAYLVGKYCTKDGVLYRCTALHAGAWNASHFTAVALANDVQTNTTRINSLQNNKQDSIAYVVSDQDSLTNWLTYANEFPLVYILPGNYVVGGASKAVTEGTEHKVIGIGQVVINIKNLNITTGGLGLFNYFTGIENITFKCQLNGSVAGTQPLFKGCSNIKNCKVIFMDETAEFAVTVFESCKNISKVDISSEAAAWALSNSNTNTMFVDCVGVEDCAANLVSPAYQGIYMKGMEGCTRVRFCDMYLRSQGNTQPFPTKYSNSTPAKTYSSTYACADTDAGGFNA